MSLTVRSPRLTSVAVLAVAALVSTLALVATGNTGALARLADGGAWLPNSSAGSVSHVGPAGIDATVHLRVPAGRTLKVVQDGGHVYVVDAAGHLSRLDQAQLSVAQSTSLASANVQVVAGGGRLYAVDGVRGTVQLLDPTTLSPLGPGVRLAAPLGAAVVDGRGVVWVALPAQGSVASVDGSVAGPARPVAPPGDPLQLSVVDGVAVSVDPATSGLAQVSGPQAGTNQQVPLRPSPSLIAPALVEGTPVLPVLDTSSHQLGTIDLGGGAKAQVDLGAAGDRLGAPQIAGGKVYIPDYSTGSLLVVILATGRLGTPIVVTGRPGSFDVVVSNGELFVNDQTSNQAWIVDGSGTVTPVSKYDPNSPGGPPPAPVTIPPPPPLIIPPTTGPRNPQPPPPSQLPPTPTGRGGPTAGTTVPGGSTGVPPGNAPGTGSPTAPTNPPIAIPGPGPGTGTAPDGSVTSVLATAGDNSATVTWAPPTGWRTVTGYQVQLQPGSTQTLSPVATHATVSGLSNGTSYAFAVTALSTNGPGATVLSNAVTPGRISTAPTNVVAQAGDSTATVSWGAPLRSPPDSYVLGVVGGSSPGTRSVAGTATSTAVGGLADGMAYTFTVAAVFGTTTSAATASNQVTPVGRPGVPSSVAAAPSGNGQVTVQWGPAPDNGRPITGYRVTGGPSPVTVGGNATSAVLTGLTNDRSYQLTVTAANDQGSGPASAPVAATPVSQVPGAPGNAAARAGDGAVILSWSAPPGNGTGIDHYVVTDLTDNTSQNVSGATSATVQGLANGQGYAFSIAAVGANGQTGPGSRTPSVTPSGAPGAASAPTASAGPGSITVSWGAAAANGTTVASYTVTPSAAAGPQTVGTTSATFAGLSPGTTVSFTVVANGANGRSGPAVTSNAATTPSPPPTPTNLAVTGGPRSSTVHMTWTGTAGVTYAVDPGDGSRATVSGSSATWSDAADDGSYTATVTGTTASGASSATRAYSVTAASCGGSTGNPCCTGSACNCNGGTGGSPYPIVTSSLRRGANDAFVLLTAGFLGTGDVAADPWAGTDAGAGPLPVLVASVSPQSITVAPQFVCPNPP